MTRLCTTVRFLFVVKTHDAQLCYRHCIFEKISKSNKKIHVSLVWRYI